MSMDIIFQRHLNLKDVKEKTNVGVTEYEGRKYLTFNGNYLMVTDADDDGNFTCIIQYDLNSPKEIMDVIVNTFRVKFITDEEFSFILDEKKNGREIDIGNIFDETTRKYGYNIE